MMNSDSKQETFQPVSTVHDLELLISGDSLKVIFTCVDHEICDAVKLINEAEIEERYYPEPTVLEWFKGPETFLRPGQVHVKLNERFVEWWYVDNTATHPEIIEENLQNTLDHEHALLGVLNEIDGYTFQVVCTKTHSSDWSDRTRCLGAALMEEYSGSLWTAYAGEDNSEFKNDYIRIWVDGQYEEALLCWEYITD